MKFLNRTLAALLSAALLLQPIAAIASDIESTNYSETAANNNATPPAGAPENMAPSTVNDTMREMMAGTKRDWNRSHTTISAGGTANAITLTYTTAPAAYVNGQQFSFKATLANTTAATANVNGLGAINLRKQDPTGVVALTGGEIQIGQHVTLEYDSAIPALVILSPSTFNGGNISAALNEAKGADIASAGTTDIGAATGNYVKVTGTTTITALGTVQAGTRRIVEFTGALTLTHNGTSLILPTAANITTAAGDVGTFVSLGSGNWKCVDYLKASGAALSTAIVQNYLTGLTIANNAGDAAHDIDIAIGQATDSTNAFSMTLGSALTKQDDATWAAGTAAGGLFSGATALGAGNSYHVFLIRKTSDGSIDAGFDSSVTAANIPAGYTAFRRIGSIKLDGASSIIAFHQFGGDFVWDTPQVDIDATNPGTAAVTRALTIPSGVKFRALISGGIFNGTTSADAAYFSSLDSADVAVVAAGTAALSLAANAGVSASGTSMWRMTELQVWTNTSASIRSRLQASGAADHIGIITLGWFDLRGQ